jgi:NAD+ kinase
VTHVCKSAELTACDLVQVLNEVVVDRGSSSFLTNITVYERQTFLTRVQADGLMIATPTGSTAYSAAAGGSMVHPEVPSILLTPICPHSLNFRPIVLPDYAELRLIVGKDARSGAWASFDGKHRQELQQGDVLLVRMSPNPVPTINRVDQTRDWMHSLDRCFGWSNRVAQQAMDF